MEEISLRELIEALLKRKKAIIGITAVAVLVTAIVSFFILEPVYETKMVLMASNFSNQLQSRVIETEGVEGILDSLSQYPNMTLETYRQQVTAPRIMREVIEELGLEEEYDIETLANAISLTTVTNTNLMTITMRHGDSEKAAQIVNKVGEKFVSFVSSKASEQATTTTEYIENQIVVEKEKLDQALLEQKEFLSQPKGTKELGQELEAKLILLTDYKTALVDNQLESNVLSTAITETENQLAGTPEKLTTQKSVIDDALLTGIVEETTNQSILDVAGIQMESEEINPTYVELATDLALKKVEHTSINARIANLQQQIGATQQNIDQLQALLAEKAMEESLISQKVEIAQSTYQAFVNKHEELRITESAQIGESSMIVISNAFPTTRPVAPRKMLNVAIAGVLGVMLGVFWAFFREYWEASGKELAEKKKKEAAEIAEI